MILAPILTDTGSSPWQLFGLLRIRYAVECCPSGFSPTGKSDWHTCRANLHGNQDIRPGCARQQVPVPLSYFCDNTHLTSVCASASVTCGLAGIGTAPQEPLPPFKTLATSLSSASFWPAYLAATSL